MNILHVFNEYLPKTEVWAFELIQACPETVHYIYADYYANLKLYEQNVNLLNRKTGLIRKKRAERSQYDFPYNMFEPLVIVGSLFSKQTSINSELEKNKIDLIHVHFGTTAVEKWGELKDVNIPLVISFYGWDYQKAIYYNPSYQNIYKSIFDKAHLVIAEGSHGKDQLIKMRAHPEKIKILPLGISLTEKPHKNTFKKNGKLQLIQVASLSEKKGQKYTLEAFEKTLALFPGKLHLTLIGDDRDIYYAEKIKASIKDNRLDDHIDLLEWVDFKDLDTFLLDYDVFIHPSVHAADGDCEGGAPVILLHAQALGLPVISTTHCDIPEQVKDRQTGFLAEERDIETLSNCISNFINMNSDDYFEMSKNCINFISEAFDVNKIGRQLKSYYVELLN